MASIDHVILKVNNLDESRTFYTDIMGFRFEGMDGPFAVVTVSPSFQLQIAPWGTRGFEHYAFSVTRREFEAIFARVRAAEIAFGPTFDSVGSNTGPGEEAGARGVAPTLYFNDPNKHLLEIRWYDE